jgi:hypothetical protein
MENINSSNNSITSTDENTWCGLPIEICKCTMCDFNLTCDLYGIFPHPLLQTAICTLCCDGLNDETSELHLNLNFVLDKCQDQDERSKDEEQDEEKDDDLCHCCFEADKGTLYLCDNQMKTCNHQFCEQCIIQNFGQEELQRIADSPDWVCFLCDQKQLSHLHEAYRNLSQASYFNQVIEECKTLDLESEIELSSSRNLRPGIDSSNEEDFSEREIVASHILKLLDDHVKQNHESAMQMEQPFVDELRARIRDELRLVICGP